MKAIASTGSILAAIFGLALVVLLCVGLIVVGAGGSFTNHAALQEQRMHEIEGIVQEWKRCEREMAGRSNVEAPPFVTDYVQSHSEAEVSTLLALSADVEPPLSGFLDAFKGCVSSRKFVVKTELAKVLPLGDHPTEEEARILVALASTAEPSNHFVVAADQIVRHSIRLTPDEAASIDRALSNVADDDPARRAGILALSR